MAARVLSALAALVLAGAALAFHLPRAHFWESPREFAAGDAIQGEQRGGQHVIRLSWIQPCLECCHRANVLCSYLSVQLEAPHAYYSMPLCTPPEGVHRSTLSPAMFLLGTESSPYTVKMMVRAGQAAGGVGRGQVGCAEQCWPQHSFCRSLYEWIALPLMRSLQTMQKGLAARNGPAYPGHAYPALTQGEVQVSRGGPGQGCALRTAGRPSPR